MGRRKSNGDILERLEEASIGRHMQPFIYHGPVYLVETDEQGIELIPKDLVGPRPDWKNFYGHISHKLITLWYGQMRSPGGIDRTDWVWGESEEDVAAALLDMYRSGADEREAYRYKH